MHLLFARTIYLLNAFSSIIARGLTRMFFDRLPPKISSELPKNLVVLRWDGKLGDAIVSSTFYRGVRKIPGVNITVITVKELEKIDGEDFGVDRVIITTSSPGFLELLRVRRKLGDVDAVVHFAERIRPVEIIFLSLLRPARVYSLDDSLKLVSHKLGASTRHLLFSEKYLHILNSFDKTASATVEASPFFLIADSNGVDAAEIIFNPFASRKDKSLSTAKSIELLGELSDAFPGFTIGILSSLTTRGAPNHL